MVAVRGSLPLTGFHQNADLQEAAKDRFRRDQLTFSSQFGDYLYAYPRFLVRLEVGCLIHATI
jgi:hypothetical protein